MHLITFCRAKIVTVFHGPFPVTKVRRGSDIFFVKIFLSLSSKVRPRFSAKQFFYHFFAAYKIFWHNRFHGNLTFCFIVRSLYLCMYVCMYIYSGARFLFTSSKKMNIYLFLTIWFFFHWRLQCVWCFYLYSINKHKINGFLKRKLGTLKKTFESKVL